MMNRSVSQGASLIPVNETVAPWMDDGFALLIEVVNVTGGEFTLGTQHLGRKQKKKTT